MEKVAAAMANVVRRIITTKAAPAPVGAYSQAVTVGNTMYMSGQIGLDAASGVLVEGGVEAETHQALKNMQAVLKAADADLTNVVKTTVLLADINDSAKMNSIYITYFANRPPARAAFQAAALPKGARVEIEAIAVLGNITEAE